MAHLGQRLVGGERRCRGIARGPGEMADICRDHETPARHLGPDHLGIHALTGGDTVHDRRHDSSSCGFELSHGDASSALFSMAARGFVQDTAGRCSEPPAGTLRAPAGLYGAGMKVAVVGAEALAPVGSRACTERG